MISLQQQYKDNHGRIICVAPLSFTAEKYIYLEPPLMTTFAAERLWTGSLNKFMLPKTGLHRVIELSLKTIRNDGDETQNTV